jgi:hypothetical protein
LKVSNGPVLELGADKMWCTGRTLFVSLILINSYLFK